MRSLEGWGVYSDVVEVETMNVMGLNSEDKRMKVGFF